jgi:RNA polymerase sigma-70 factor (ECF subfamily)
VDDIHRVPYQVAEAVARASYARLVSYLAARSGDVASAEDALAEAFVAALKTWPRDGVPHTPEAWLLHAARRRAIDGLRKETTQKDGARALRQVMTEAVGLGDAQAFPDDRLKLLFVCAHPAIDPRVHTPLMLQVVLGLDAAAISSAFLAAPATMGQRLSRAKAKIRDARIAFEVPAGAELPARLFAVLEAIYAAYGSGWAELEDGTAEQPRLAQESMWLARTLVELMPEEPEPLGLLALILYCEARRPARRTREGEYVPLSEQDTRLWIASHNEEAERILARASHMGRLGRFQLEAAVQSAHVERARGRAIEWPKVAVLYEGLVRIAPTLGALVGRAAAVAEAEGPRSGLSLLDALPEDSMKTYQPYWAVRAHLLRALGQHTVARAAYQTALALTEDDAVRRFLLRRSEAIPIQ